MSGALWCVAPSAAAQPRRGLVGVEPSPLGVTLTMQLVAAPFPDGIAEHQDATVLVFVPKHHRLEAARRADVVVHFHGHNSTAKGAMLAHQLREQLYESRQNAILVVPQGPVRMPTGDFGKLMRRGGLARMLGEVLAALGDTLAGRALGAASLASARGSGMVCISAHSGGYRAAAACLERGGVEVSEVYLFDALYGDVEVFRRWVVRDKGAPARKRHKLVSQYAGGAVTQKNLELLAALERQGVRCHHERRPGDLTKRELMRGRAIFIAAPLAHGEVPFVHNGLRDCLYASGLRRRLESDWFEHKDQQRRIERRG